MEVPEFWQDPDKVEAEEEQPLRGSAASQDARHALVADLVDRNPCDVRYDVSAAIKAGYGPRKRSPTAERRR